MTKLTDNQVAVFNTINEGVKGRDADYIQDGEFGVWFDTLAMDAVEFGIKDKKQARVTINQLIKKGLFKVDTTVEEGSSWLELTDAGKDAWTEVLSDREEPAADEDLLGEVVSAEILGQDVLEGTPEDEVAEALAEIEEEDLLGDVAEAVSTHTENYTVREWTDAEEIEWTETIFNDGSRTIKRRKNVSGSWRTDYWGAEFEGDAERYTTAKLAKMARAYGGFSHEPK